MSGTALGKEKLFAYLVIDDIQIEDELLNKAKSDDGYSLSTIADIYYDKKDHTKAIGWYHLSAAQSHPYAQSRLAHMYCDAEGVSADYKLAMEWYLKAHNNGFLTATNAIGYLYDHGLGVPEDYNIAMKWILKAANKGLAIAQRNIGVFYECGRSVEVDRQYALEWYEKSAQQGYEKAKIDITRLNKKGFYITEKQKSYIQIEIDNNKMKKKIKVLEEEKLALGRDKKNLETQNRLLEQEIRLLKLNNSVSKNEKVDKYKHDSNNIKAIRAEESPENDIYYDD